MDNDELKSYINKSHDEKPPTIVSPTVQRRTHRHSSKKHWIYIFSGVVLLQLLIICGILIWATQLQEKNEEHFAKEKELAQIVKDEKTDLEAQRWEFNKLKAEQAKTCLPNLVPLKYDRVLEINNEYVRSGIFMLMGKKEKKSIEFKLVMQNNAQDNIVPKVNVLFFNATGNQVGMSQMGYQKDEPAPSSEIMEKGEVRSYNGSFDVNVNIGQPEFVMIKVLNSKQ